VNDDALTSLLSSSSFFSTLKQTTITTVPFDHQVAAFKNSAGNFQLYSQHSPINVISKHKERYLGDAGTTQFKSHWALSETDNRIFTGM
jgi:hypothetical protein